MGQDCLETHRTDLAEANMLVPVKMCSNAAPTIIEMDEHKPLQANHLLKQIESDIQCRAGPQVVSCSMKMTGVQAYPQTSGLFRQ